MFKALYWGNPHAVLSTLLLGGQHWLSFMGLCEKSVHSKMGLEHSSAHSASWRVLVLCKYPGWVFQFHCPRH